MMSISPSMALLKKELIEYFGSFYSYFITALVLLINGILFQAQVLSNKVVMSEKAIQSFFYFSSGVVIIAGILLSARLLSEEYRQKTDQILKFSELNTHRIIYIKFVAALCFLCFLLLCTSYVPIYIFIKGQISLLHIAVGYLGLLLIGSISIAVGMFCSSLTSYVWLSATLTSLTIAILVLLWMLASVLSAPFKEVVSFLAIHDAHFASFQKGIIQTQTLAYYLALIVVSLESACISWKVRWWSN